MNRLLGILLGDIPFCNDLRVYNYRNQRESLSSLITLTLSNLAALVFSLSSSMINKHNHVPIQTEVEYGRT